MALSQIPECVEPPDLFDYDTWCDADGYHAKLRQRLPWTAPDDLLRVIHASTALELTQEAARNRVRVWRWETSR